MSPRRRTRQPYVVFVPISVAWVFTAERGWHVLEDPASAVDMDRLVEMDDEAEARSGAGVELANALASSGVTR